jgi:hypothetical protein
MVTALREAAFGNLQEARRIAASVPPSQLGDDGDEAGALAFAIAGDLARAESLLDAIAKQYPKGTLVQVVVLPTVQARIQLSRNSPDKSIQLLHSAEPYELTDAALGSCIYPPMCAVRRTSRSRMALQPRWNSKKFSATVEL